MGSSHPVADFDGTPFHPRTAPLNFRLRWCVWDRYHVADEFAGLEKELKAIRTAAAVLDMSPLAKLEISGPDAMRFTNYLITRNAGKMEVGQIIYTPWCDHKGKVISDGMVFRVDENRFRFTGDPSAAWFNQVRSGFDIEIRDITHEFAILSLQGPKSKAVLEAATGQNWADLKFSRIGSTEIGGVRVEVGRQGFTGERGYELCVPADGAVVLWDAVMAAGQPLGLQPAGYAAIDRSRIEAGLVIPGPDFTGGGLTDDAHGAAIPVNPHNQASPFELRAGRFVDFDKGEFVGRDALLQEKQTGSTKHEMVGLVFEWQRLVQSYVEQDTAPAIVPHTLWMPMPVMLDGSRIGRATSVTWSPTINQLIGFGFLERGKAGSGDTVSTTFDVRGSAVPVPAKIVALPFVELRRSS